MTEGFSLIWRRVYPFDFLAPAEFSQAHRLSYSHLCNISMVILVSKRAIDAVFESLFILTDIRVMLRETAPQHNLDESQREKVRSLLDTLEKQVVVLKEELA